VTTLTRATLGKLRERATKDVQIGDHTATIQRPTPREFAEYQTSIRDKKGEFNAAALPDAILLLVARMWIDGDGERLFDDDEVDDLGSIDLPFYSVLSEQCQSFANDTKEAKRTLGESGETTRLDLQVASA
jgi:hypothetical protein